MGFFKSFFSGEKDTPEMEKQKNDQKNFDLFKYDGIRALRMGRVPFAIKCFTEALKIQDDAEIRNNLVQAYIQSGNLDEARQLLEQMTTLEENPTASLLSLASVCYMQEDYLAMADAAQKAIAAENENATAYYLLGKALDGQGDSLMSIAHLTKAIALKEDFTEARLKRAEVLTKMHQYTEALEDIDSILSQIPDAENALLLCGKIKEATKQLDAAENCFKRMAEINPFNEQAYLCLGQLYISQNRLTEAIDLFDEAIELNPNSAKAYHERGHAKLLNGDKEGAAEDLKKELELNPEEINAFNGQFNNQTIGRQTDVLGL